MLMKIFTREGHGFHEILSSEIFLASRLALNSWESKFMSKSKAYLILNLNFCEEFVANLDQKFGDVVSLNVCGNRIYAPFQESCLLDA